MKVICLLKTFKNPNNFIKLKSGIKPPKNKNWSKKNIYSIFRMYREELQSVLGHAPNFLVHVLGQKIFKKMRKPNFSKEDLGLLANLSQKCDF